MSAKPLRVVRRGPSSQSSPEPLGRWAKRRAAMTFQAHADVHAFEFERAPVPFSASEPPVADEIVDVRGELSVRLHPVHADGACEARVRYALHGAAGAPVVIVQGGISADRDAVTS